MDATVQDGFWKQADTITSVLVHISIVLAALAGVLKFKLWRLYSDRYMSELECRHHVLSDGRIIFTANYAVKNTGERPVNFNSVTFRLCGAKLQDGLLVPDENNIIAKRAIKASQWETDRLFHIEADERSFFTLNAVLSKLEPVMFVMCQLEWSKKRPPAPYIAFYVAEEGARETPQLAKSATGRK